MKTLSIFSTLCALIGSILLFTNTATAKGTDSIPSPWQIRIVKSMTMTGLVIQLNQWNDQKSWVTLRDEEGVALFSDRVDDEDYQKLLNLEKLPIGNYELIIRGNSSVLAQPFKIEKQGVSINPSDRQEIASIATRQTGDRIVLSLKTSTKAPVRVSFFDSSGESFFVDTFNLDLKGDRVYNLSQLFTGDYSIHVSTSNHTFNRTFSVR